jgi:uncharacterized membrane protein YfcA
LALVGLRILLRFSREIRVVAAPADGRAPELPELREPALTATATAGGVTNGLIGAWGPIVTPFLLHKGVPPRYTVGCVNTAEVAVATVAAGSLIASLGRGDLEAGVVIAMLLGGVVAAPLAAMLVRHIPARALGVAVGGLLLLTNARELANWRDLDERRWLLYGVALVAAAIAGARPWLTRRRAARRLALEAS